MEIFTYLYYVLKDKDMSYTIFNRHQNMNRETLKEIGSIIFEVEIAEGGLNDNWNLINMLYGLYDGYLYDDLILEASNIEDNSLFRRILKVWTVINKYPTLFTSRVYNRIEEDKSTDFTENVDYKSLGVADGKLYLASLEN